MKTTKEKMIDWLDDIFDCEYVICKKCGGLGNYAYDYNYYQCDRCEGCGKILKLDEDDKED